MAKTGHYKFHSGYVENFRAYDTTLQFNKILSFDEDEILSRHYNAWGCNYKLLNCYLKPPANFWALGHVDATTTVKKRIKGIESGIECGIDLYYTSLQPF